MKYRIKNETQRNLISTLFRITELETSDDSQGTTLCINGSFAGNNYGIWFFKTEPIPQLAEGWNLYPQTKPQKEGRYLVALKCSDNSELDFVDAATFTGNCFSTWQSDIIAWREMPKIWKEQK